MARRDATQAEAMICQSTQEWIPQGMLASFQNQAKKTVKFGKKAEEAISDSRKRTADTLFTDLESVALASEGRDLNITEDTFVPTAKCIRDTKERQLVTGIGLQGPQCCYAISTTYRQ